MRMIAGDGVAAWGGKVIDVRGYDEYLSGRLPGAECVPLDRLPAEAKDWDRGEAVLLVCKSGKRAAQAAQQLESLGFRNVAVLEGGIDACRRTGMAVVRERKALPIMQQAMIIAGTMVLLGVVLSLVHPAWIVLSGVAGAGLVVAGATGFCLMAKALALLPWNRTNRTQASCSK